MNSKWFYPEIIDGDMTVLHRNLQKAKKVLDNLISDYFLDADSSTGNAEADLMVICQEKKINGLLAEVVEDCIIKAEESLLEIYDKVFPDVKARQNPNWLIKYPNNRIYYARPPHMPEIFIESLFMQRTSVLLYALDYA